MGMSYEDYTKMFQGLSFDPSAYGKPDASAFRQDAMAAAALKPEDYTGGTLSTKDLLRRQQSLVEMQKEITGNNMKLAAQFNNETLFPDFQRRQDAMEESVDRLRRKDEKFTGEQNALDRGLKADTASAASFMNNENNKYKELGEYAKLAGGLFRGGNFFA